MQQLLLAGARVGDRRQLGNRRRDGGVVDVLGPRVGPDVLGGDGGAHVARAVAERVARPRARLVGVVDLARRHLHRLHRELLERRQPLLEDLQALRLGELRDEHRRVVASVEVQHAVDARVLRREGDLVLRDDVREARVELDADQRVERRLVEQIGRDRVEHAVGVPREVAEALARVERLEQLEELHVPAAAHAADDAVAV